MTARVRLADVLPDLPAPQTPRAHVCVLASLNFPGITPEDVGLIRRFTRLALTTLIELGATFELWDTTEALDNPSGAGEFDGLLLLGGGDIDGSCYGVSTPNPAGYGIDARDCVTGVVLDTGETLAADLVVEAVGSVCNVEWLDGNGLDLRDGVLTDNNLAVVGAADAVAVGDVARFPNPLFDDVARRVEHWSIPTDTAKRAAATLTGTHDTTPFAPIPAFWSDQLDLRLQSYGSPALADEIRVAEGDLDDLTAGVVVTYHRDMRHVGTVAVNLSPARCRALRDAFAAVDVTA